MCVLLFFYQKAQFELGESFRVIMVVLLLLFDLIWFSILHVLFYLIVVCFVHTIWFFIKSYHLISFCVILWLILENKINNTSLVLGMHKPGLISRILTTIKYARMEQRINISILNTTSSIAQCNSNHNQRQYTFTGMTGCKA